MRTVLVFLHTVAVFLLTVIGLAAALWLALGGRMG